MSKRPKVEQGWRVRKQGGTARTGEFADGFLTPAILTPTVGGLVPHLTPDIWEQPGKYDNAFICVSYEQAKVFTSDMNPNKSLHFCLNVNPQQVSIVLRLGAPTKTNAEELANQCRLVESALEPNLFCTPGDWVHSYVGSNRSTLAVDRTTSFTTGSHSALTCIVGRDDRAALACLEKSSSSTGLFIDTTPRSTALNIAKQLPQQKMRAVATCAGTPKQVLEYIAAGYDLVETSYPQYLAKMGFASTFVVDLQNEQSVGGADKQDMRDKSLMVDRTPIMPSCACFTCQNHTKAYVRHLLETREMLGETLLYAHNLYRLMELVRHAREQIELGTFEQWYAEWKQL